jgi:hypothetical protein
MFSSINRKMTMIGAVIQGTARGSKEVLPYFIMITEVEPDTLDDVMYYNPSTNDLLDESDFLSRGNASVDTTGDSVDESAELPA